eukprot:403355127
MKIGTRANPIYFSNNVIEVIRGRMHADKMYYSFSLGMVQTIEGAEAVDSLTDFLSKIQPKQGKGLMWNPKLAALVDPDEIRRIDVQNVTDQEIQEGEQEYIRNRLLNECDYAYEHIYVFTEFMTSFGFEIVGNLLREDGSQQKLIRQVMMSPIIEYVTIFHEQHISGKFNSDGLNYPNADDTLDMSVIEETINGPTRTSQDFLSKIQKDNNRYSRKSSMMRSLISGERMTERLDRVPYYASYPESIKEERESPNYSALQTPKQNMLIIDNNIDQKSQQKLIQFSQKPPLHINNPPQPVYDDQVSYQISNKMSEKIPTSLYQQNLTPLNITQNNLQPTFGKALDEPQIETSRTINEPNPEEIHKQKMKVLERKYNLSQSPVRQQQNQKQEELLRNVQLKPQDYTKIQNNVEEIRSQCNLFLEFGDFVRGYSLGLQRDPGDYESQCYMRSDTVATKFENLIYALLTISITDYMAPITVFNQLIVDVQDQLYACNFNQFINQFKVRFSTWPGAFNLIFDIIYLSLLNQDIKSAFEEIKNPYSCMFLGYDVAYVVSYMFDYKTEKDFLYDSISTYYTIAFPDFINLTPAPATTVAPSPTPAP